MQKTLRIAALILAVMVVVVLAVAPVSAAPAQQGGGNTAPGRNNWQTLMPGQRVEWIFNYAGGNDPANIEVAMDPANSVDFNVFDDAQWTTGETATPKGKGTQRTTTNVDTGETTVTDNGNKFWSTASSGGPQRYHIQVFSTSGQPVRYWINASGAGVASLVAFNANASNASLQGQSAQGTSANAGASAGATANNNNLPAPRTLPQTGGSDLAVLFAAAAAALIAGGWLARRRTD